MIFIFRNHCELLLTDNLWKSIYFIAQKMNVSEYVCKNCLKESDILLKCLENFTNIS